MKNSNLKPINRSKLRLMAGRAYYSLSRYTLWYSGKIKFAKSRSYKNLEYVHFSHKTPLLRKLGDVDMMTFIN